MCDFNLDKTSKDSLQVRSLNADLTLKYRGMSRDNTL